MPQIFEHLTPDDRRRLLEAATRCTYPAGASIIEEGSPRRAIFLIRSGQARVEKTHLGTGIPLHRLGPGELFGEMAFLEESVASASVVAEGPVEAVVLEAAQLRAILESDSAFSCRFHRALAITLSCRLRSASDLISPPFSWG